MVQRDVTVLEAALRDKWGIPVRLAVATSFDPRELTPGERSRLSELKSEKRQRGWLLGRAALKGLLAGLGEKGDTSRIAFPSPRFSLTHSGEIGAAAAIPAGAARGIGVDLEMHRRMKPGIEKFFLSEDERRAVDLPMLLRLWTIKEALYKSVPFNGEIRMTELLLRDPRAWEGDASIRNRPEWNLRYASIEADEGFFSAACSFAP